MSDNELKKLRERNEFLEKFYIENSGRELEFRERVKELNCMYNVAKFVVTDNDLDSTLLSIIDAIPAGWQHPELVEVNIELYGRPVRFNPKVPTDIYLKEELHLNSECVGSIIVYYHDSQKINKDSPFLPEEKDLLAGISRIIDLLLKQNEESKHKQLIQAQLLHSDRLATIGQLSAGVAHELNEPLSSILGFAQLVLGEEYLTAETRQDLKNIEEASLHAKEIIQKLMNFSRQSSFSPDFVNFKDLIKDGLYFIHNRCTKKKISIETRLVDITVLVDPVQIKQVITNLTLNAIQAMEYEGKLEVELKVEGQDAILLVKDNGHGIAEENISKVFMPFFTTKDVGEGTGLGLSVVYGIVKSHGGDISVSSELNKGTTFQVKIPIGKSKAVTNV